MRGAWGHKIRLSLYFEGEPDEDRITFLIDAVNREAPEANFVGCKIETIQDEPKDQINT